MRIYFQSMALYLMLSGSLFYVYSPSFALGTLIVFLFGPVLLFNYTGIRNFSKIDVLQLGLLGLLVIFGLLSATFNSGEENLQYLKAFLFAFFSFALIGLYFNKEQTAVKIGVCGFAGTILAIGWLQQLFVIAGVGIDPANEMTKDYVVENAQLLLGVQSIFGNPNDFSVICNLLLILFLYGIKLTERQRLAALVALSLTIILVASRLGLISLILISISYYSNRPKKLFYFALYAIASVLSVYAILSLSGVSLYDTFWGNKIYSLLSIFGFDPSQNESLSDGSVDYRMEEYAHVFRNIFSLGFGSFSAQNYNHIVTHGGLFSVNPHSLGFELALLFGYPGILIFFGIFMWLCVSLRAGGVGYIETICLMIAVFLLSFASSSCINIPSFWVLLFLIGFGVSVAKIKFVNT